MRDVAIIGTGMIRFGELWNDTLRTMWAKAALAALDDAGVKEVDFITIGCMSSGLFTGQEHLASMLADELGMPVRLVRQVLSELAEEGIFSKTEPGKGQDSAFQPACDITFFTVKCVLDTLEKLGSDSVPVNDSPQFARLTAIMDSFGDAMENSPENMLLRDI